MAVPSSKTLSAPVLAALLCLGTAGSAAIGNVIVRLMSAELDTFQIAFFRNLFGFASALILPPLVAAPRPSMLAGAFAISGRMWLASALNFVSMFCFFTGIALMPLGDLTALSFAAPVWSTIGAALLLGETVHRSRWIAPSAASSAWSWSSGRASARRRCRPSWC